MKPIIGTSIGDPAGISSEVLVRALADQNVHDAARHVLIGSADVIERALKYTNIDAKIRRLKPTNKSLDLSNDASVIDIIDNGILDGIELPLREDTLIGGQASASWLEEADKLARAGLVDALVMAPISAGSLKMADKLDLVVSPDPGLGYLVLVSGPLRVAHLTDHISLREVCDVISKDLVFKGISDVNAALKKWGIDNPRIGVSGLNPHADGVEDREEIAPGVEMAKAKGINVEGPISPDSIFRQCIDGAYDIVLAMYHDQGHIAIKTWGFSGNCVIMMGPPYLNMSVAHGTAYDITGTGKADHTMMKNTMILAGSLIGGSGFVDFQL